MATTPLFHATRCVVTMAAVAYLVPGSSAFSAKTNSTARNAISHPNDNTGSQRPNIIFIISDDHRWDAMSCVQQEQGKAGRFPWFKTPNMDRIAMEGARFRNAFVVQSLCSPSRAAFLTGQYGHRTGVVDNSTPIPIAIPNWASILRDTGYATGYFGKWHCKMQKERPGFQRVYSYLGQGEYFKWPVLDDGRVTTPTEWLDDAVTSKAIEFIEQHKDGPFAMVIGFKSPHAPRKPPARHENDFADITIDPPLSFHDVPPFMSGSAVKPVDWQKRQPDWKNYFRCLAAIDDDIGSVLDSLERLNLAKNTIVIYVGDNGFFLGEHGLDDKRNAQEESMRIPLLMTYPKAVRAGTLIDDTALNIDLAPTLIDFAGITSGPLTAAMQGKSWKPLFAQEKHKPLRDAVYYESFKDPVYPKVTFDLFAVRTSAAKFITYPGHEEWTELYDLNKDPYERKNLATDPSSAGLRKTMENLLVQQKQQAN